MKTTIAVSLGLLLLGLGIVYAQTKSSPAAPGNPGRFQIIPAEYIYLGKSAAVKQPGVFRVNTETGETWIFKSGTDEQGKGYQFWGPIE